MLSDGLLRNFFSSSSVSYCDHQIEAYLRVMIETEFFRWLLECVLLRFGLDRIPEMVVVSTMDEYIVIHVYILSSTGCDGLNVIACAEI